MDVDESNNSMILTSDDETVESAFHQSNQPSTANISKALEYVNLDNVMGKL